ncbi:hypothetical protein [Campylobacter hyointestinalis]|uniref:hypothetical protein n=1 Tax=Campylobacter hyointestinalis TaxID=198 RepID=UPI000728F1D6|nr:hypothetical protein [Campylobacter hyointestinalis]PPB51946.1 hypothetical protein CDQ67_10000 [Campylobacter hyointestinalis subsp. hyointestinalis]CUU92037.1 Uncharacterised protein [Campylobacter hyointestinalis subsp. hyointestinalis]
MKLYDITTGELKSRVTILNDKTSLWMPIKGEVAILKDSGVMIVAIDSATTQKSVSELKNDGVVLYGPTFIGNND